MVVMPREVETKTLRISGYKEAREDRELRIGCPLCWGSGLTSHQAAVLMEAVSTDASRRVENEKSVTATEQKQGTATMRGGCWGRDTHKKHSGQ